MLSCVSHWIFPSLYLYVLLSNKITIPMPNPKKLFLYLLVINVIFCMQARNPSHRFPVLSTVQNCTGFTRAHEDLLHSILVNLSRLSAVYGETITPTGIIVSLFNFSLFKSSSLVDDLCLVGISSNVSEHLRRNKRDCSSQYADVVDNNFQWSFELRLAYNSIH